MITVETLVTLGVLSFVLFSGIALGRANRNREIAKIRESYEQDLGQTKIEYTNSTIAIKKNAIQEADFWRSEYVKLAEQIGFNKKTKKVRK